MTNEGRGAHRLAAVELGVALDLGLGIAFLWIAAPPDLSGRFDSPPWIVAAIESAAWVVYLVGMVWMTRIFRSHLEPEPTGWRYRDD